MSPAERSAGQRLENAEPHRGHAGADGDAFRCDELHQTAGIERRPGQDERGARQRRRVGKAPAVDVKHRHDREHDITLAEADTVGGEQIQRLKRDRPMRIDNALRSAGGARGVAHRGGRTLITVEILDAFRIGRCEQFLVGDRPVRQVAVANHDHMLDARRNRHLVELRQQTTIEDDHPVLGMLDDVREIAGVQANVQRVKHGPHRGHRKVRLQVLTIVPGQRRDTVARTDAEISERACELLRPSAACRHTGSDGLWSRRD